MIPRAAARVYIFGAVFWPLIGGFIAFLLVVLLIGWAVDPDRAHNAGHDDRRH